MGLVAVDGGVLPLRFSGLLALWLCCTHTNCTMRPHTDGTRWNKGTLANNILFCAGIACLGRSEDLDYSELCAASGMAVINAMALQLRFSDPAALWGRCTHTNHKMHLHLNDTKKRKQSIESPVQPLQAYVIQASLLDVLITLSFFVCYFMYWYP